MTLTRMHYAWVGLVTMMLIFIWASSRLLNLWSEDISPRYSMYAIPTAISEIRGMKHDYTAYHEVAAFFLHTPDKIEKKIERGFFTEIRRPQERWFVSGDDKGLSDLVLMGFATFGGKVSSIHKMAFLLFAASVLVYCMEFSKSPNKMLLLISVLAGLYMVLFTFNLSDQSTSFIEPRFIGFVSLVALLHLLVTDKLSWTVVAQVVLLVFVIHLRSSELWQALCVLGVWAARKKVIIPAVLVAAMFGLMAYRHITYHQRYFDEDVSTRVIWHNVLMGLAINTKLRSQYQLAVLKDEPIAKAVSVNSGKSYGSMEGNFKDFNWALYEPDARSLYFKIVKEHPVEVLRTYLFVVPTWYIAGLLQLPMWRWEILLLLIACALMLPPHVSWKLIYIPAAAVTFSLIPPVLATPVYQYIQLSAVVLLSLIFVAIALALSVFMKRSLYRLRAQVR